MPHLIVRLDGAHYFHADFAGPRANLGRGGWAQDVHISIAHPSVDELHASIEAIEGGYKLVDRSGGRTWWRGKKVAEQTLVEEMELKLGDVWVTFYEGSAPAEPRTALDRAEEALPRRLWLTVKDLEGHNPVRKELLGDDTLLGAGAGCAVRLPGATVSGKHARIVREARRLLLLDEGSRNGTLLPGGVPVERCTLPLGVPFRIGPFELRVDAQEEAQRSALESMLAAFRYIERIAPEARRPVLVTGETGTGKEAAARAIHDLGPRAGGPFVPLDCTTLTETLAEAQLFGNVKGAFTGAGEARDGLFVAADGGTLFLDEVGELSLTLQPKLLRALQEGEVRPVGSTSVRKVDVRVVAATNRDLAAEVEAGRFRADLYWRLAVIGVHLPPLRERGLDIVLLFQRFLGEARPGDPLPILGDDARAALRAHRWPGNVRELQTAADRTALNLPLRARGLDAASIPFERPRGAAQPEPAFKVRGRTLEEIERDAIAFAMREHGGNRKAAASQLGVTAATLLAKLRKYGLEEEGKG